MPQQRGTIPTPLATIFTNHSRRACYLCRACQLFVRKLVALHDILTPMPPQLECYSTGWKRNDSLDEERVMVTESGKEDWEVE